RGEGVDARGIDLDRRSFAAPESPKEIRAWRLVRLGSQAARAIEEVLDFARLVGGVHERDIGEEVTARRTGLGLPDRQLDPQPVAKIASMDPSAFRLLDLEVVDRSPVPAAFGRPTSDPHRQGK